MISFVAAAVIFCGMPLPSGQTGYWRADPDGVCRPQNTAGTGTAIVCGPTQRPSDDFLRCEDGPVSTKEGPPK